MPTLDTITCPTCNKDKTWREANPFRPFCSKRCKLIDLGDWASEKHSIPGEEIPSNDLSPHDENDI